MNPQNHKKAARREVSAAFCVWEVIGDVEKIGGVTMATDPNLGAAGNIFAGLIFPSAVSVWLLVKTTAQLERVALELVKLTAAVERLASR